MTGGVGGYSARPVFGYKRGGHRGRASDEIPGPHLTHFRHLVLKETTPANALCSLLPNIGGAGVGVCRLYVSCPFSGTVRGSGVGRRSDGESSQSDFTEEAA